MKRKRTWKERVRPFVERVAPAAKIAERTAYMALRLQRPSLIGIVGTISAAANAANDALAQPPGGANIPLPVARSYMLEAFEAIGARVTRQQYNDGTDRIDIAWHGFRASINTEDRFCFHHVPDDETFAWIRGILEPVLPPALLIRGRNDHRGEGIESLPINLELLRSQQGEAIWKATEPLLGDSRCILLNGRPGVGKTTMAREIATIGQLGRVALIESALVGPERTESNNAVSHNDDNMVKALAMVNLGAVIVDDIDKIYLSLSQLEGLRRVARLVILTANNGEFDDVLDGSMIRAGRVDEVFDVVPQPIARRYPFDKLTDTEWAEVSQWPIAYLNELEKRLVSRPNDLRLDDLRFRLTRRVRSGTTVR